jgi:hypothetical protein
MSFFEPDYNINNQVPKPKQIGLKRGGRMDDVKVAGEIAAYYGDLMTFGASSSQFTKNYRPDGKFVREFGIKPIQTFGVNYFVPTSQTCHNGAQMYYYVETIPRGDALGKNVQRAFASVGLPPARGLVPGAIEDAKEAMDMRPINQAIFGSIYPVCEKKTLYVGTADGKIKSPEGKFLITEPKTVERINGFNFQTRWVQAKKPNGDPITLTKEEFDKIPKSLKFNGISVDSDPKPQQESNLLSVPPSKTSWNKEDLKETFTSSQTNTGILMAITIPLLVMLAMKFKVLT